MEKGSGTVKIFATTMTQEAHKEGKGGEWKRAKIDGAGRIVQEPHRVDMATRPDRHPARMLTLAPAGRALTSGLKLLSRREAIGLRNPECGGVR